MRSTDNVIGDGGSAGIAFAIIIASVALSGCGGLPGTGGANFDINTFLNSTTCAHDDSVKGVTGAAGIPASLQFEASRHCPAIPPVAPPAPAGQ